MNIFELTTIVCTFHLCFVIGVNGDVASNENERIHAQMELYNDLLKDYHKYVSPVRPHPNASSSATATVPTTVEIGLSLQQLISADTEYGEVKARIWLSQYWTDHRLVWDPSTTKVDLLHISASEIWKPDLTLYNGRLETEEPERFAILHPDGHVYMIPSLIATLSCEREEKHFPHDRLSCKFRFGSWVYHSGYLDVITKQYGAAVDLSSYIQHPEWYVHVTSVKRTETKYECCPERYVDVEYMIEFVREPSLYTATMSTPASLIAMAMVFIFVIPPTSREKMNLAIGILICLVIFAAMLLSVTSSATTMSTLLLFAIILDLMIIAETSIVYNIYFRTIRTHPIPDWVRTVFMDVLSRPLCLSKPNQRRYEMELNYAESNEDTRVVAGDQLDRTPKLEDVGEEWRFVARVIDRLCFWIFLVVFIIGVCSILAPTSQM